MKLKNFFITLALVPFLIFGQELDQVFLDSLPENVREDVESRADAKKELEKPVYRSASSFKDKDFKPANFGAELFGYEFFDTIQTSFMPINEPNLDSSYILDFGDILEIQIVGQKDSIDSYIISRDGSISLPDIGKVNLSGLSMNDASSLIKAKIEKAYIGTRGFVSLKSIRDISVLITGNAFNPGIYTLNGNSNMLHAIFMAGGINEIGSYRDIELIRNGKTIDTLDIYDILIFGKFNFTSGLKTGDIILVNPVNNLVFIESGVLRPAVYEMKPGESFEDLIRFANGFNANADTQNINLKRLKNGKSFITKLDKNNLKSIESMNNDAIFIKEFSVNKVVIEGAILNPGTYVISKNTTLKELIKLAGGYESFAYPFGGYLENQKAKKINEQAKTKLYDSFINNIVINGVASSNSNELDGMVLLLQQLKDAEITGRIIAEFDIDLLNKKPELDTVLEDGDRIIIPAATQQVYIHGEVGNAGAIRYSPGEGIDYYIEKAGGSLQLADLDNIFIVHPNGETENLSRKPALSFYLAEDNKKQLIYPGSIIYIPKTGNFANTLQSASIWAPIISSIALSLTSLSVLNNSN